MDVTKGNYELKDELDQRTLDLRATQLNSEKEWVNSMVVAQQNDDAWNRQKKKDIIHDLRQTYAE